MAAKSRDVRASLAAPRCRQGRGPVRHGVLTDIRPRLLKVPADLDHVGTNGASKIQAVSPSSGNMKTRALFKARTIDCYLILICGMVLQK